MTSVIASGRGSDSEKLSTSVDVMVTSVIDQSIHVLINNLGSYSIVPNPNACLRIAENTQHRRHELSNNTINDYLSLISQTAFINGNLGKLPKRT